MDIIFAVILLGIPLYVGMFALIDIGSELQKIRQALIAISLILDTIASRRNAAVKEFNE